MIKYIFLILKILEIYIILYIILIKDINKHPKINYVNT